MERGCRKGWTRGGRTGGGEAARRIAVNRKGGGLYWRMARRREERRSGRARAPAIILHRFTPVRDGWTRNEVWDLGVSTCARLILGAWWMYYGMITCMCLCARRYEGIMRSVFIKKRKVEPILAPLKL